MSVIMQMCTWAACTSLTLQYEQTPLIGCVACMLTFKHNFSVDVGFAAVQAACTYRVSIS